MLSSRKSETRNSDEHVLPRARPYAPVAGYGVGKDPPGVNANEYGCVNFFRISNFSLLVWLDISFHTL
jgi:hypothetical protein